MASRSYRRLKNGFKKFLVKEPVYIWLLIFILVMRIGFPTDNQPKELTLRMKKNITEN